MQGLILIFPLKQGKIVCNENLTFFYNKLEVLQGISGTPSFIVHCIDLLEFREYS